MKKIASLRAALTAALPELAKDPDRLRIWIESGTASCTQTPSHSFSFSCQVNVLLVEIATDIALVTFPILNWLRVNQPDLLAANKDGMRFEADILDNGAADILFELQLAEHVSVTPREDGSFSVDYRQEPDPLFDDELPPCDLEEGVPLTEILLHGQPAA